MTERTYSNRFKGTCRTCNNVVAAETGLCFKVGGKWAVEHKAGECPPTVERAAAAAPKAPKANQFGGKCQACGKYVQAKQGRIVKTGAGWKAQHLTPADCEAAAAAPAPKAPRSWNVPTGYYAIASRKGNDLDFFRVNTPTTGKWIGWSFADEVIGGQGRTKIDRKTQTTALDAIEAVGADVAGKLYADTIGNCCKCNLLLTDDESRARGMGLKCFNDSQKVKVAA